MELTITRKLGRAPSPKSKIKKLLMLSDFADIKAILAKIPENFGHDTCKPASGWGMAANDQYGCCVWAGAYHEHDLANTMAGRPFKWTDKQVLADYSKVTGFDPAKPETDQGTDMMKAAAYRLKTGIADTSRRRHKIAGYVGLEPGNWEQYRVAAYLFGAAGIGMLWTGANWDQMKRRQPIDYVRGASNDGGHYICGVGDHQKIISTVSWGAIMGMTRKCYDMQVDEALAYVIPDYLNSKGQTPEGFDLPALLRAVQQIASVQEPATA
jgi:hypothetical protein